MRVYLESPHLLIRAGLVLLLNEHHTLTDELSAEIAIKDLVGFRFPYPPPSALPTLAIIYDEGDTTTEVLRVGYRGYVRENDSRDQLERALRALLRGENWAERHVIAGVLDKQTEPGLTNREKEVYSLILQDMSNEGIALQLNLSVHTVKIHVSRILHKMQVRSRRALIVKARSF